MSEWVESVVKPKKFAARRSQSDRRAAGGKWAREYEYETPEFSTPGLRHLYRATPYEIPLLRKGGVTELVIVDCLSFDYASKRLLGAQTVLAASKNLAYLSAVVAARDTKALLLSGKLPETWGAAKAWAAADPRRTPSGRGSSQKRSLPLDSGRTVSFAEAACPFKVWRNNKANDARIIQMANGAKGIVAGNASQRDAQIRSFMVTAGRFAA